ncbi:MAG: ABC transporter substrate-binding protein [Desulfosudaceae bacterium]
MPKSFMQAVLVTGLILLLGLPGAADNSDQVKSLLKTKIDKVLEVLKQPDLSETQKRRQIMDEISPVIDFPLMAKLSLGKQHWQSLSEKQRKDFVDLFVKRLKNSYLDKTSLYSDQEVVYEEPLTGSGKVAIPTKITTNEEPVKVIYKFYRPGDAWKIYDIEIEGVSFIKSYRSQFNEILKDGTVEDLFKNLQKSAKEE